MQAPEASHTPQGFSQVASRRGSLTNKIYIHAKYYSPKYSHCGTYEKKFLKQIVGKCKIVLDVLIILKPVWKIYSSQCTVALQCLTGANISHGMVFFNVLKQSKQWKTRISLITHQIRSTQSNALTREFRQQLSRSQY